MIKPTSMLVATLMVSAAGSAALAAAPNTNKPATAIVKATPGPAATGVICQITKTGNFVHVQAVNKGKSAVPAGATFAFTIVGPTKKTAETFTFKTDLAPDKAVNVTKAIKATSVVSCSPSTL